MDSVIWIASYVLVFLVGMFSGMVVYKATMKSVDRYIKEHPQEF